MKRQALAVTEDIVEEVIDDRRDVVGHFGQVENFRDCRGYKIRDITEINNRQIAKVDDDIADVDIDKNVPNIHIDRIINIDNGRAFAIGAVYAVCPAGAAFSVIAVAIKSVDGA